MEREKSRSELADTTAEKNRAESIQEPQLFSLQDTEDGIRAVVCSVGASLVTLEVPLKDGSRRDVVLGYEDPETYYHNGSYLGVTVAPSANRIGGAAFSLNGEECFLDKNDGENCLHGGYRFLQDRAWEVTEVLSNSITFSADCKDGENGFPGPLHVDVTYTVQGRSLQIDYHGSALHSQKDVLFNPTNHSYFNLNGQGSGDVLSHRLTVFADQITPWGPEGVPDGTVLDVAGTPFDFSVPAVSSSGTEEVRKCTAADAFSGRMIGEKIEDDDPVLRITRGYDHNYVLLKNEELHEESLDLQFDETKQKTADGRNRKVYLAARLADTQGEVTMDVFTDLPGLQLYTANNLDIKALGKEGRDYPARSAVCLETQYFPNAVNIPSFLKPVIRAGEEEFSRTVYRF